MMDWTASEVFEDIHERSKSKSPEDLAYERVCTILSEIFLGCHQSHGCPAVPPRAFSRARGVLVLPPIVRVSTALSAPSVKNHRLDNMLSVFCVLSS